MVKRLSFALVALLLSTSAFAQGAGGMGYWKGVTAPVFGSTQVTALGVNTTPGAAGSINTSGGATITGGVKIAVGSFYEVNGRSLQSAPADGQWLWTNQAATSGVSFTFSTDTALSIFARDGSSASHLGVGVAANTGTSITVPSSGSIYWNARAQQLSPADGQTNFTNSAGTAGIGLDFSTDGTVKVRTRAQSADANLQANSLGIGTSVSGTAGVITVPTNGEYRFGANTHLSNLADGVLAITNNAATAGVSVDVSTDGIFKVRNRANSANANLVANNIQIGAGGKYQITNDVIVGTAPTVTSAGTSPSVPFANGTVTFRINVGTGGTANTIVLSLPGASNNWNCTGENITGNAANRADARVVFQSSTTTAATLQYQTVSTGAAKAFTASDIVSIICFAE